MKETQYLCICTDCRHSFRSDKIPVPQRRLFPARSPRVPESVRAELPPHCVSVRGDEYKSTVRCPQCGSRRVILGAVID